MIDLSLRIGPVVLSVTLGRDGGAEECEEPDAEDEPEPVLQPRPDRELYSLGVETVVYAPRLGFEHPTDPRYSPWEFRA